MLSTDHWLSRIKTNRSSWYLTLLSVNYTSSNNSLAKRLVFEPISYHPPSNSTKPSTYHCFQVTLLVPSTLSFAPSDGTKHLVFDSSLEKDYLEKHMIPQMHSRSPSNFIANMNAFFTLYVTECRSLLMYVTNNRHKFNEFELMFADRIPFCGPIVSDLLELHRIDIAPSFIMRTVAFVEIGTISYVPEMLTFQTDKMSFIERARNLGHYVVRKMYFLVCIRRFNDLKMEFKIKPERHYLDSFYTPELLILSGHFALEYPQPILPGKTLFVTDHSECRVDA